jgi:DNA-binding transcriptional regulator LsrR (DeoR family)
MSIGSYGRHRGRLAGGSAVRSGAGRQGGAAVLPRGVSKVDIADRMGISRFRMAPLPDAARDAGIVRIEVGLPAGILDVALSAELCSAFGLEHADSRMIVTSGPALQRTPFVLCVAYGAAKSPAVFAAIRGRLVHGLVIHASLARALLPLASQCVGGP